MKGQRRKLDIFKFCRTYGLEFAESGHHHCAEGWVQLHCPFCGSHNFHLGFNIARGNFNCWRCGGHSLWDTVGMLLNTRRSDLIGRAIAQHETQGSIERRQLEAKYAKKLVPPPLMTPLRTLHKRYLRSRDFDVKSIAEEWDLLCTSNLSGDWNWRIISPICDRSGRAVAHVGRHIGKHPQRWKITDKAEWLVNPQTGIYGIHKVPGKSVLVVEGASDVWRMGPGAVGTLGISWKRPQADILRQFERRFILFDPEPLAQRKAKQLADYLAMFPGETELVSGFKTDPGDLSDKKANRVMKELGIR